jgi:hypothetical protein
MLELVLVGLLAAVREESGELATRRPAETPTRVLAPRVQSRVVAVVVPKTKQLAHGSAAPAASAKSSSPTPDPKW